MPIKAYTIRDCHLIGSGRDDDRDVIREYDTREKKQAASVYSSLCVGMDIVRADAPCESCHGVKPLINGFCAECRAMGANERQCLKPALIRKRAEQSRRNSAGSWWRYARGEQHGR